MEVKAGDQISIPGKVLGQPERRGMILGVEGDGELRLRVRWENGQKTVWMPHGAYKIIGSEEPTRVERPCRAGALLHQSINRNDAKLSP